MFTGYYIVEHCSFLQCGSSAFYLEEGLMNWHFNVSHFFALSLKVLHF